MSCKIVISFWNYYNKKDIKRHIDAKFSLIYRVGLCSVFLSGGGVGLKFEEANFRVPVLITTILLKIQNSTFL